MLSLDVRMMVEATEGLCNKQMQGEICYEHTEPLMFLNYKLKGTALGAGFSSLWGKCDVIIPHS